MVQKKQTSKKRVKEKILKPEKKTEVSRKTPSYVNLVYGAVTVVVLFLLAFFAIRTFTNHDNGQITEESATDTVTNDVYTVKEGDTLWGIAESELGSGYEWKELVAANEIKDPANLEAGTELIIPELTQAKISTDTAVTVTTSVSPTATLQPTSTSAPTTIVTVKPETMPSQQPVLTAKEYVVKPGDTLWDISVKAYGNGYKWVEIARANNLSNPDLIFSGNKLALPR